MFVSSGQFSPERVQTGLFYQDGTGLAGKVLSTPEIDDLVGPCPAHYVMFGILAYPLDQNILSPSFQNPIPLQGVLFLEGLQPLQSFRFDLFRNSPVKPGRRRSLAF
jgi:hypothetical protein